MSLPQYLSRLPTALLLVAAGTVGAALGQPAYEPRVGQAGKDVVWVPTPQALVDKMLDMANVTPSDYVIDLGSGDGRKVIAAAKRGAKAHGIEHNPDLVELSKRNAAKEGVAGKATFANADLFESDFSSATVLTMFLLTDLNIRLRPIILKMKPGTRVVSNTFGMGDWQADQTAQAYGGCQSWCRAHLWIVPANVDGTWQLGESQLTLEQKYQNFSGKLTTGTVIAPITNGKLHGDQITFTVAGTTYAGRVSGDAMEGPQMDGSRAKWKAMRAKQVAAVPPVSAAASAPPPPVASKPPVPTAPPPLAAAPPAAAPPKSVSLGRRVALVIGNAAYRTVKALPNPINDGRELAGALRAAGFTEVVEHYDLGLQQMRDALKTFEEKATGADWAVVYYAGHGIEVDGRNYLIPVDAALKSASDVEDETLPLDRVLARVAVAKRLQLVILDACRDNPFVPRMAQPGAIKRTVGARGLARIEPDHPNLFIAYSARHGEAALDGTDKNSPYTKALVKHLAVPGLALNTFFIRVRTEVLAETSGKQRPFEYGSLTDENLFFRPPRQ